MKRILRAPVRDASANAAKLSELFQSLPSTCYRARPGPPPRTYGRNAFGWSLLLARRLVEGGVSLVQINLGNNETWYTHQAFPNLKDFLLPPTDRAVSALLDDLHDTGLLDTTLVVTAGEFGRTPRIFSIPGAKLPGRDHWGAVQTLFFAGGGVRGGTVVGSSDKAGGNPRSDPQTPENLGATIYSALGLLQTAAWHDPAGRPHFIYQGKPIPGFAEPPDLRGTEAEVLHKRPQSPAPHAHSFHGSRMGWSNSLFASSSSAKRSFSGSQTRSRRSW
jgi:hypothetical protein